MRVSYRFIFLFLMSLGSSLAYSSTPQKDRYISKCLETTILQVSSGEDLIQVLASKPVSTHLRIPTIQTLLNSHYLDNAEIIKSLFAAYRATTFKDWPHSVEGGGQADYHPRKFLLINEAFEKLVRLLEDENGKFLDLWIKHSVQAAVRKVPDDALGAYFSYISGDYFENSDISMHEFLGEEMYRNILRTNLAALAAEYQKFIQSMDSYPGVLKNTLQRRILENGQNYLSPSQLPIAILNRFYIRLWNIGITGLGLSVIKGFQLQFDMPPLTTHGLLTASIFGFVAVEWFRIFFREKARISTWGSVLYQIRKVCVSSYACVRAELAEIAVSQHQKKLVRLNLPESLPGQASGFWSSNPKAPHYTNEESPRQQFEGWIYDGKSFNYSNIIGAGLKKISRRNQVIFKRPQQNSEHTLQEMDNVLNFLNIWKKKFAEVAESSKNNAEFRSALVQYVHELEREFKVNGFEEELVFPLNFSKSSLEEVSALEEDNFGVREWARIEEEKLQARWAASSNDPIFQSKLVPYIEELQFFQLIVDAIWMKPAQTYLSLKDRSQAAIVLSNLRLGDSIYTLDPHEFLKMATLEVDALIHIFEERRAALVLRK